MLADIRAVAPGGNARPDRPGGKGGGKSKPVLLDLDGNGLSVDTLATSTQFIDFDGDGELTRTAWAGKGDGVLILDADGDGKITRSSELVFAEWDPKTRALAFGLACPVACRFGFRIAQLARVHGATVGGYLHTNKRLSGIKRTISKRSPDRGRFQHERSAKKSLKYRALHVDYRSNLAENHATVDFIPHASYLD